VDTAFTSLPIPTGNHQVGTIRYDLEDLYRKDFQFPHGRLIPIQIYFPMKKGPHTAQPKIFEKRAHIGPFHPLHTDVYHAPLGFVNFPHAADLSGLVKV